LMSIRGIKTFRKKTEGKTLLEKRQGTQKRREKRENRERGEG